MITTEFDYPIVVEALKVAKVKDQRIGHQQHWYITIEQLHQLMEKQNEQSTK